MSNLQFVTITGADNSIPAGLLNVYSNMFPWVEWGILLSQHSAGNSRFPNEAWLNELYDIWQTNQENSPGNLKLSGHICGRWVRDILKGRWIELLWTDERLQHMFSRFQLNFHSYIYGPYPALFEDGLYAMLKTFKEPSPEIIFQMDGVNDTLLHNARDKGAKIYPLFDISGGRGLLPEDWPKGIKPLSGYAGGLSLRNILEQLPLIEKAANGVPFWIDLETHVRSAEDQLFDLTKVEEFLEVVEPFINTERKIK